jgi:RNA polymerase sigma factor (sigma-70 family)
MRSKQVTRPLQGDEEALFRAHHDRLLRLVRRDTGATEALVEDACCFAWLQLLRYQPERERVAGWLRVVARHEAYRLMRKDPHLEPLDELVGQEEGGGSLCLADMVPGDFDLERAVEARQALRALAGLRWRRRRVLALHAAGYSYKEIAEKLDVTYTNVNRHITEGRAELREMREAA